MKKQIGLTRIALIGLTSIGILFASAGISNATSNLYMKIDNLQGESLVQGRANQVELNSFSFGVSAETSFLKGTGAAVGKAVWGSVTVQKDFDSISPSTMQNMAKGTAFKSIIIEATKQTGGREPSTFLRYTFTDSFITGDSFNIDDSGSTNESLSFIYKTMKVEYFKQGADGRLATQPIKFGWDIAQNKQNDL